MAEQPIEEKLMIEVTVGRLNDGPIVIVAHGKLEQAAENVLRSAADGLGQMLDSGWRGRVWIDPDYGHIRLNAGMYA